MYLNFICWVEICLPIPIGISYFQSSNEIPCKKSFYVHYTSFLNTNECISKLLQVTNSVIKILIDFANINREKHDLDLLSIWDKRFEYIFLIRSTEEYEKACNRIENGNLNAK